MGCYTPLSWELHIEKLKRKSEDEIGIDLDKVEFILIVKDPHPRSLDYETLERYQICLEVKTFGD